MLCSTVYINEHNFTEYISTACDTRENSQKDIQQEMVLLTDINKRAHWLGNHKRRATNCQRLKWIKMKSQVEMNCTANKFELNQGVKLIAM